MGKRHEQLILRYAINIIVLKYLCIKEWVYGSARMEIP